MKVIIDALGASSKSGGMRLYADELISAWATAVPTDELHVIGGRWLANAFESCPAVTVHVVPESNWVRVPAQWLVTAWHAMRLHSDVVISVSLVVSPFVGRRPRICVVHDWRHLKRPEEFGLPQVLYRKLWVWSTSHATRAVQISQKTYSETAEVAPRAKKVLIENGGDHAARWPRFERPADMIPTIVTFGHQSNKRPDLVIRAFAELLPMHHAAARLVVLGASGAWAEELAALAGSLGLGDAVVFPGFVSNAEYQRLVQWASAIVVASTDEGFGLPVSEGAYFGIPVVSTTDNGVREIHGSVPIYSEPTARDLGASLAEALRSGPRESSDATSRTWSEAARKMRALAVEAVAEYGAPE